MMPESPYLPAATEPLTDEARFSQILSPYWSSAEDYRLPSYPLSIEGRRHFHVRRPSP